MPAAQTTHEHISQHGCFGRHSDLDALRRRASLRVIQGDKTDPSLDPERAELANALADFVGQTLRWKRSVQSLAASIFPLAQDADDTDDWVARQLAKRRSEHAEPEILLDQEDVP